jgi:hypothetical protein
MTAKGSVTPGMACGSRPVEDDPEHGAFPAVGTRSGPGLSRGQIGVWTGLIIPAPIWREGRDSPSGLRSHGWRSDAFSPLTRRRPPQVGKTPLPTRRNRISAFAAISANADAGPHGMRPANQLATIPVIPNPGKIPCRQPFRLDKEIPDPAIAPHDPDAIVFIMSIHLE